MRPVILMKTSSYLGILPRRCLEKLYFLQYHEGHQEYFYFLAFRRATFNLVLVYSMYKVYSVCKQLIHFISECLQKAVKALAVPLYYSIIAMTACSSKFAPK